MFIRRYFYQELRQLCLFFFFQAEDGIRDHCVTGVQTCALPILLDRDDDPADAVAVDHAFDHAAQHRLAGEIGRASCRKSVDLGGRRIIKKKKKKKKKQNKKKLKKTKIKIRKKRYKIKI